MDARTPILVVSTFDSSRKPLVTIVKSQDHTSIYDLFRKGSGRKIHDIQQDIAYIRSLFEHSRPIITNDFLSHVHGLNLSIDNISAEVSDLDIGPIAENKLAKIADQIVSKKGKSYNKLIASVAPVYAELTRRGLFYNFGKVDIEWSLDVFSRRSKTLRFNLQGFTDDARIRAPFASEDDVLVCFDWVAADIRSVAALSDDVELTRAFLTSDPYTHLQSSVGGDITREECKLLLLKTINSLDAQDPVVSQVYPQLSAWLSEQQRRLDAGYTTSLLGRKFYAERNRLSAFNGAIQGTTAHAMHSALRNVFNLYPNRLVGEIHDSIILNCPSISSELKAMIEKVSAVMVRPFEGIIDSNPIYPIRVSIGKKWRKWNKIYSHNGDRLIHEK